MRSLVVSAAQMRAGPDPERNLETARQLVQRAADDGAELVALPELFGWSGPPAQERDHAETVPGPTTDFAAELARAHGMHVVAGSVLERCADDPERCFNTCALLGPEGTLLAAYRKIHLFDVDIVDGPRAAESRTRAAGSQTMCIDTELGRIGLAICYDLRFPELFRRLADAGAEIIVMPSAFTATTGAAHWMPLIRARAIENQCYFVAPNQHGPTSHGFSSYGHSVIIDPWGEVLAEAGEDGPDVVTARLAADRLVRVRAELPSLAHRRLPS
ncbi:MAG: carbon-nitrogen hydrolase family protein [Candidatus Binatia bacterium]